MLRPWFQQVEFCLQNIWEHSLNLDLLGSLKDLLTITIEKIQIFFLPQGKGKTNKGHKNHLGKQLWKKLGQFLKGIIRF
jgi:hypothetical protein